MSGKYDALIVGAGLYGATFAQQLTRRGAKCLVIDRRSHVAGIAYTEEIGGIQTHMHGAHIFHTSDKVVWDYVNNYAEFNSFINSPLAVYKDEVYNLPFNMNTFAQMWGVRTPAEARRKIAEQTTGTGIVNPANLEEQALSAVGPDIYNKLIKGYTEKQWGRPCAELPTDIIKRLPCRFTYNNNYYNDRWQGIPTDGYTAMVSKILSGIDVRLNASYADIVRDDPAIAERVIYTGSVDEYHGYRLGSLAYRSLRFETEELATDNYQGNAVINYTAPEIPYTRVIEHKHFTFAAHPRTVITREYPAPWRIGMEPYYPINTRQSSTLYQLYINLAKRQGNTFFGGRLGKYKYYDMDQVIKQALNDAETFVSGHSTM